MIRLLVLCLALVAPHLEAAIVDSGNVKAELISEKSAVVPGEPLTVALRQQIREGWHTYWINPGDSGARTELSWTLPPGFEAGPIQWPVPERVPYGPLMNYGYHGEVLFPVEIEVPTDIDGDSVTLAARGSWLVCADICIPEKADLTLTLPVEDTSDVIADHVVLFEKARASLPTPVDVPSEFAAGDETIALHVSLGGTSGNRVESIYFFPFAENVIENPAEQKWRLDEEGISLTLVRGFAFDAESSMDGVLVVEEQSGDALLKSAFEIRPSKTGTTAPAESEGQGILMAMLFAFLGGVILNLMPCVFPVLSIKVLSLVQQVGSNGVRLHGWVYVAGVVVSFLAIAAVLIALRAGGDSIGWGFQLQSPMVVTLLAYLFLLIGLNLSGVFEVGATIMNFGQNLTQGEGLSGSFFTGVLATVVAAPCTAPFMASAIGYALTQNAAVALSVFAALGLGMATPYLLLCYSPALLERLPRPGPWMIRFKEFLAFPMYASAVWLVWVLSVQAGSNGVLVTLSGMVLLAFAVWLLRHLPSSFNARFVIGMVVLALVGAALYLPATIERGSAAPVSEASHRSGGGPAWETYSPSLLAENLAQGPVFVNFTAAWCITCKVNEAVALSSPAIANAFEAHGVTYLKGDWTNEDPQITEALAEYGRSGVPLYLLFEKGEKTAEVLPQILTETIVLDAIDGLKK